jgi:hypothetical protein
MVKTWGLTEVDENGKSRPMEDKGFFFQNKFLKQI